MSYITEANYFDQAMLRMKSVPPNDDGTIGFTVKPDMPESPLKPEMPEKPLKPEIPLKPDVPLKPENPDVPLNPLSPEKPDVPEIDGMHSAHRQSRSQTCCGRPCT